MDNQQPSLDIISEKVQRLSTRENLSRQRKTPRNWMKI